MKLLLIYAYFFLFISVLSQNALLSVDKELNDSLPENEESSVDQEEFIPSKTWQPIHENQKVPAGLHYRINLETGLKEAKLLDDDHSKSNFKAKFTHIPDENLEEKLSKLPDDGPSKTVEFDQSKYRSYNELKADFANINMQIETESEIVSKLVKQVFSNQLSENELITALDDIEYYVHKVDTAADFVGNYRGILMLESLLNRSSEILASVFSVLGACMQSNPGVQVEVFKSNIIFKIMSRFQMFNNTLTQRRALYSIASQFRHFPHAQNILFQSEEFVNLCKVVPKDIALLKKFVIFISDLAVEHRLNSGNTENLEKRKQYAKLAISSALKSCKICDLLISLLNSSDDDTQEKGIEATVELYTYCNQDRMAIYSKLISLHAQYEHYFNDASSHISDLKENLITAVRLYKPVIVEL